MRTLLTIVAKLHKAPCVETSTCLLHLVLKRGCTPLLQALLSDGDIDTNMKNNDGDAPIHLVLGMCDTELLKVLLTRNDLDTNSGVQPLFKTK
jgi:ankyrin repeat protein